MSCRNLSNRECDINDCETLHFLATTTMDAIQVLSPLNNSNDNNTLPLESLLDFAGWHIIRDSGMHRQHEHSQVNQHVSTSLEGRRNKNHIVTSEDCFFSRTMADSGKFYLKLVKATLITIVML